MNAIEKEVKAMIGCRSIAHDSSYSNGWDAAVDAVLDVLKANQHLILDDASESKMMFVDDENILFEDKQKFVRNLGKVAAQTRDGVVGMELDEGDIVNVNFTGGGVHRVNIHMDSYSAIIRDCGKAVD